MGAIYRAKVHASAREDRVVRTRPDAFEVWVRAKPERGEANRAVLGLLARELGLEPKRLRILKGASSPSKLVQVLGA